MRTCHLLPVLLMSAISITPVAQAKKGHVRADEFLRVQAFATAAPAAQGKVTRFLVNPFGEVDGLLLDTGNLVTFPKHMGEQLAAAVKPGDTVEIKGYPEAAGQIKGYVITNSRSGESLMVQPKPPKGVMKMPKHLQSVSLRAMNAQGEIRHLHYGKRGEINGVILSDGTTVRFPHEASYQFAPMLKIGQSITVSGYGTKNQYGQALEATELAPAGEQPQPVYQKR
ncbi:MAG TPA: hypothetical protein VFI43_10145 [Nitrosospira sp.]|nr:hypothetical protein [Nitrosospira sp.]